MPWSKSERADKFAIEHGEKRVAEPNNPEEFLIDSTVENGYSGPGLQVFYQYEQFRTWPHCPFPGPVVWRAWTWSIEDGVEQMPWIGDFYPTREEAKASITFKLRK